MEKFYLTKTKIIYTLETLLGLIDGIIADGIIKPTEIEALRSWLTNFDRVLNRAPFKELAELVGAALSDNHLDENEIKDIRYFCNNMQKALASDSNGSRLAIHRLHGVASGIASDGALNSKEWNYLSAWIRDNLFLKGSWPYDEVEALTIKHRCAVSLTREESEMILHYLNDFCGFNGNAALTHPLNEPGKPITGICAVCPEIVFEAKAFCITGKSNRITREKLAELIIDKGGSIKLGISASVDYLIICSEGSPMWTYSCYGRKVEEAVSLRKIAHPILIVHEFDLMDSIRDAA